MMMKGRKGMEISKVFFVQATVRSEILSLTCHVCSVTLTLFLFGATEPKFHDFRCLIDRSMNLGDKPGPLMDHEVVS